MIKLIFRIITWAIRAIVIIALILYPFIMYDANPLIFYWDKITLYSEAIKDSQLIEKAIAYFK